LTWRRSLGALLCVACTASQAADPVEVAIEAAAEGPRLSQRPLWELGVGVTGIRLPDYRGADQSHSYLLPFPYVIYRGKWLKADRDGARALLLDAPRVKLDLSFGATAPARDSEGTARDGMPDLPGTAEIGPNLSVTLAQSLRAEPTRWKLDLRLPVRAAFSLERSPEHVGTTLSPNLNLDISAPDSRWNIGLLTGPLFADARYHRFFYGVDAEDARPQRAAYRAHGGYAGWQSIASTSRRFGNTWFGAFVRHEALNGAAYEDSPLVQRRSALTLGFGVAWVLATSSESVASAD